MEQDVKIQAQNKPIRMQQGIWENKPERADSAGWINFILQDIDANDKCMHRKSFYVP